MIGTPTWVKWFGDLADKIDNIDEVDEVGENGEVKKVELIDLVKRIDWGEGGPTIPDYKNDNKEIDPFSVILYLAQTFNDHEESLKEQVREVFEIGNHCDVFIPAPPGPRDFREDDEKCCEYSENTELLWKLFRQARQGIDAIDPDDFANAIKNINGVGPGNLTLGLFFINPEVFMPIIEATLRRYEGCDFPSSKEADKQIRDRNHGLENYKSLMNKFQSASRRRPFYKIYAECINGKERSWLSKLGGICCKVSGFLKYRDD